MSTKMKNAPNIHSPLNFEKDFPLSERKPEILFTPTGKAIEEITMENLLAGKITEEDCRISETTLEYQAQISESAGNPQMALNFRRAAELTRFSDEEVLTIYEAIRPYRSTKEELEQIADDLERKGAHINSHFIKEAIAIYEKRKKLKGDK